MIGMIVAAVLGCFLQALSEPSMGLWSWPFGIATGALVGVAVSLLLRED